MKSIVLSDIVKTYKNQKEIVTALAGISFEVNQGEIFGLIGPDGAGKTSCIRILTSLIWQDSGQAIILGMDNIKESKKIRSITGYMPGRFSLYQDLTVEENLNFFASIFNTSIRENYDLIKDIYSQIEPFKDRLAGKLSGGMKQKLALSCAMIHKPEILLLDEPTTGVDAVSRREFWDMLTNLKAQGLTILVSTPYMDEATRCDRVALMQKGQIMAVDSPKNICLNYGYELKGVKADNLYRLLLDMRNMEMVDSCQPFGEYLHVRLKNNAEWPLLEKSLISAGHESLKIIDIEVGIEDCFIELMKNT